MAVLLIGRQGKALRRNRCRQIDDHAQVISAALRRAHTGDRGVGQRKLLETCSQLGATDVDNDAIRCGKGEHAVLYRARQIEDQTGIVRGTPQTHAPYIGGSQGLGSQGRQQHPHSCNQRAYAHNQPHRFLFIPCCSGPCTRPPLEPHTPAATANGRSLEG